MLHSENEINFISLSKKARICVLFSASVWGFANRLVSNWTPHSKRPNTSDKNEKVERKIESIVKNNYIFDEQKYAQWGGKNYKSKDDSVSSPFPHSAMPIFLFSSSCFFIELWHVNNSHKHLATHPASCPPATGDVTDDAHKVENGESKASSARTRTTLTPLYFRVSYTEW